MLDSGDSPLDGPRPWQREGAQTSRWSPPTHTKSVASFVERQLNAAVSKEEIEKNPTELIEDEVLVIERGIEKLVTLDVSRTRCDKRGTRQRNPSPAKMEVLSEHFKRDANDRPIIRNGAADWLGRPSPRCVIKVSKPVARMASPVSIPP